MTNPREFLPVSAGEMRRRGWDGYDFLFVTGDAYVDHPSFGLAIISRVLEDAGYRIAVLAQPDCSSDRAFSAFGRPRLAALVSAGNIDSMVSHYTVAKKRRSEDDYSPGGKPGRRPDRAATVYAKKIREVYPDLPVVLGGLEASLRRFAHYDYWDDRVRPSVLCESTADLLVYGMGELAILDIAHRLAAGCGVKDIRDIRGTCYMTDTLNEGPFLYAECAPYEKCIADKAEYAKATRMQYRYQDHTAKTAVVQRHGACMLVQNPPARPLTTEELDGIYALPYMRTWHPVYEPEGGVPGIAEVRFSIIHNRGCFGACTFCSLAFHQGRVIQSRSHASVIDEAKALTALPDFKGYIHDVGGPTANFRRPACKKQMKHGLCTDRSCLTPEPCPSLEVDHRDYLELLRKLRALPGVKKVFVRSGIRYDYLLYDKDETFFYELVQHHISGQLKVAPEHVCDDVLFYMNKPKFAVYKAFEERYRRYNEQLGKKQYLVPYLISSHPGSTLRDAVKIYEFLKSIGHMPEQVQDFYPTPGTIATCMYYTGLDPRTMKPVFVAKTAREKALQRALLQWRLPQNRELVREALRLAEQKDAPGDGGTAHRGGEKKPGGNRRR